MDRTTDTQTPAALRKSIRIGAFTGQTAGQAPGHLQGNLAILPAHDAADFLQFCMNNPKPCPLIGFGRPGERAIPELGDDLDVATDVSRYRVYRDGRLDAEPEDISALWQDDFVTFVLGCSFSFEQALIEAGYSLRHIEQGCNVAMYRTSIETVPGGDFRGPMVVSMRPFPADQVPAIFDLCANFPQAHGTPVYWGDPAGIGIADLDSPDYGDALEVKPDEVPVFWACGVTPQAAIDTARPSLCITHAPGHMLVTDVRSSDPPQPEICMVNLKTGNT